MRLNTLSPNEGSRQNSRRVGRGIGSGLGKTCGKGHKGQKARSGGYHRINFEGGQMPIQRRLPKLGFKSRKARFVAQLTLSELDSISESRVDMVVLRASGLINQSILSVKIILSGEISSAKEIVGLRCTKGAREAIIAAGGKIEE
ncbi:MAG: 50S ribosomal protein L15 [Legionellaceae bacterium]|nr:50S ribosomal protein L15 [Legionellaceae bacterium]